MLPAVSAELPAYLVPPTGSSTGRSTGTSNDFGPAATVELTSESVRAAQSRRPGVGLYGPNGQFVEPSSSKQGDGEIQAHASDDQERALAAARAGDEVRQARLIAAEDDRKRQLSLAQVDAALPPAQRDELKELAKRVQRKSEEEPLQASEYKRIASLMQRVGDFDKANEALDKAKQLEKGKAESTAGTGA